jgi:hypothetical protein
MKVNYPLPRLKIKIGVITTFASALPEVAELKLNGKIIKQ